MAKINDWVHTTSPDYPYPQVEGCTSALLKTIQRLDVYAKPKQFNLSSCCLLRFASLPSDEKRHTLRVISPSDEPIDETYAWQVTGTIGGRIVNVVCEYIFHTYTHNRSGNGEWHINGKDAWLRADMGGLDIDDIWQDENKWRRAYTAIVAKECNLEVM